MTGSRVRGESFWNAAWITTCLSIGVLLLSWALRLYGLNAKSLWQDEIFTAAIASTENSVLDVILIPLYNTALPAPPLYFLVTHFFLYIEDNDLLLRFPALLFGVLGVATTYALGARLFGKREGLAGALLLSISPLCIRYSQDSRFYSLLLFLSLFSLYSLYRALVDKGKKWWAGFAVCSILNLYNHLFALFVLLADTVFVVGLWLGKTLVTARRTTATQGAVDTEQRCTTFDRRTGKAFLVSLVVIGVAYVPWFQYLLRGLAGPKGLAGTATGGISFTPSFLIQQLDAWGIGSGWPILVLLAPFLMGVIVCARAERRQLWLAFCWFVVPFAILSILPVHHRFRPRYALFMLPLYLLLVARGLTATSQWISARLPGGRLPLREAILGLFLLVITMLSVPAIEAYHAEDRADWRASAALLARNVSPGDVIISPGAFALVALPRYEPSLGEVDIMIGGSEVFLSPDRDLQGGVWFVGLQEEKMEAIETEVREETPHVFKVIFELDDQSVVRARSLKVAPVMYKDVWVMYVREGLGPQEVIGLYKEALQVLPSSAAFSIHIGLGDSHRAEREWDQAVLHYQDAVLIDPSAPEPHYGLALVYKDQGLMGQYQSEWRKYEELASGQ